MLRYLTAGESHGPGLTAIVEGLPKGLRIDLEAINAMLERRQSGYGRGGRMKIEADRIEVSSGIRGGVTLGSPVAIHLRNEDHQRWVDQMHPWQRSKGPVVSMPRPGHADLAGSWKYGTEDVRDVLERASARETAARTAVGALAVQLLEAFDISVLGYVRALGKVEAGARARGMHDLRKRVDASAMRCPSPAAEKKMVTAIKDAARSGDTLGGWVEVVAQGVPPGLGSHVHWDRKLDGRLAQALMAIQSVKGIEIGAGFQGSLERGSKFHDPIVPGPSTEGWPLARGSNRAGGIEGGTSNGEPILIRLACKPISTLKRPLPSVDLSSGMPGKAHVERSDICVLPAASVIAEAVTAWVLAESFLEKFGGDTMVEIRGAYDRFRGNLGRKARNGP